MDGRWEAADTGSGEGVAVRLLWEEAYESFSGTAPVPSGGPASGLRELAGGAQGMDSAAQDGVGMSALAQSEAQASLLRGIERAAFQFPSVSDNSADREKLDQLAERRIDSGKDRRKFRADMELFEQRAGQAGLSNAEVARTFREVARLLEADQGQTLDLRARTIIARQVMHLAAVPTHVDSGYHKTCNVTAVESRLYTRHPSAAARLVADVATGGSFVTADGTVITPDRASLRPDNEASGSWPRDGQRGYAGQIFQVTAVNVFWQRKTVDPAGNVVPRGSLRYEQVSGYPGRDTGERLMNQEGPRPVEVKDRKGNLVRQPFLRTNDVVEINHQITGLFETDVLIENANKPDNGWRTLDFGSEQELGTVLTDLKNRGRLPVILAMHTGHDPFKGDSRSTTSQGVWHVLTITDYDAATGKVSVDNQWGTRADHLGRKAIDLKDVYRATLAPGAHNRNEMIPRDQRVEYIIIGDSK